MDDHYFWHITYGDGTITEEPNVSWVDTDKIKPIKSLSLVENGKVMFSLSKFPQYLFMREAFVSLSGGASGTRAIWLIGIDKLNNVVVTARIDADGLSINREDANKFLSDINIDYIRPNNI